MRLTVMDLDLVQDARPVDRSTRPTPTCSTPTPCPRTARWPALLASGPQRRRASTSTPSSAPTSPRCRRPPRASRTPRRWTSSTSSRREAVKKALAGTADGRLPVLSIAAPFNRDAAIPAGDVTVRDVAGLYIYDNTLLGIVLTGAAGARPTWSSRRTTSSRSAGTGPFAPDAGDQRGHPDRAQRHAGLQLRHHGRPRRARWPTTSTSRRRSGSRIKNLTYGGAAGRPGASSS